MSAADFLNPYAGYVYGYPHKTAYRPLTPYRTVEEVWSEHQNRPLFLYVHVPFCRVRCGFCNLFATTGGERGMTEYVDAVMRQGRAVKMALGQQPRIAQVAIGGGTPSQLPAAELERLLNFITDFAGVELGSLPSCIEVSPDTLTDDKLALIRDHRIARVSLGVQSFRAAELQAIGRPQQEHCVLEAIEGLKHTGARLNLDLIYGAEGQTLESWEESLRRALSFEPEELFLYPLYVRRLTGLSRRKQPGDDLRLACYRLGRDLLLESGYVQQSMRCFIRAAAGGQPTVAPEYHCQEDAMLGLGTGARSYTTTLHYSTRYAVGAEQVREIIAAYTQMTATDHMRIDYGFELNSDEQRRRYLLLSLLHADGLDRRRYRATFGADALDDFPQLDELGKLLVVSSDRLHLTAEGVELSDAIGPWLFSRDVQARMGSYEWR